MTDSAALPRGGNVPAAAADPLPPGIFPAARLAPARWLGDGESASGEGHAIGAWGPHFAFRGAGDIFAPGAEASGAGLAIALAETTPRIAPDLQPEKAVPEEVSDERCFLWVQDRAAMRLGGRPYHPGLPRDLRHRMVHVAVKDAAEALFALEEGIRCRDLAFVIGEVAGNPREFDFTASRRLVLAAERHGVPLWLVRLDARRDLGAARMRWEVASAPSLAPRWNAQAPGAARWKADLFRARGLRPGTWWITRQEGEHDRSDRAPIVAETVVTPRDGDLAGAVVDRSLASAAPQSRQEGR
ncbi:hypothetical protein [Croceicoccus naphthovorans]|uniref:hypothetical protein n=1 Tax=Croceicoccus naphthovorans TaxID=1348774 RepID=UPI000AAACB18|nr:hypothetical protein [Croceicoccus naphthovorans]MBB3990718.1 protein ImuA [Croceicoccus naphthovorans]